MSSHIRFRAHLLATLRLLTLIRRKHLVGYLVNVGIGLLFPLILTLGVTSNAPKAEFTLMDLDLHSACISEGPCYTFAWGPVDNILARDVSQKLFTITQKYMKQDVTDIGFNYYKDMVDFLGGDGLGHVGVGFFLDVHTSEVRLFVNGKTSNIPYVSDTSLQKSPLLLLQAILNECFHGQTPIKVTFRDTMSKFYQDLNTTSIAIVSMSFIVSGLYTLSTMGLIKSDRRLEYLICHGLDRSAYITGAFIFSVCELNLMLLGTIGLAYILKLGSPSNPTLTFVVFLFSLPSIASQNGSWALFCSASIKKPNTMNLVFFLPSVFVSVVQMILVFTLGTQQMETQQLWQIASVFLSIIFPPFGGSSYFAAASRVFQQDLMSYTFLGREMAVSEGLLLSTSLYPSLLSFALAGILSTILYFFLALFQVYTSPASDVPKPRKSIVHLWPYLRGRLREAEVPDEYAVILRDVSVYFRQKQKTGNKPTGEVLRGAIYTSNGVQMTTQGFQVRENDRRALDHLSLRLPYNTIVGLLGVNGSGKTTLLKALQGIQKPTTQKYLKDPYKDVAIGKICLLGGYDPTTAQEALYSSRHVSLVFQENILFPSFTMKEQLDFISYLFLYDLPGEKRHEIVAECLEKMDLTAQLAQKVETLSGGQKRRLNILMSMLLAEAGFARLLIMDEPTCGVNVEAQFLLWKYLHHLKERARRLDQRFCVIITTHLFEEVEELCEDIVMMKNGRLLAVGSQLFFKTHFGRGYTLSITGADETKLVELANRFDLELKGNALLVDFAHESIIPDVIEALLEQGISPSNFTFHTELLSDLFLREQLKDVPETPSVEHPWLLP
ncbi:ABC transporter [Giardia muris]|uniref:ABC transporter n=1 Tax=Giardia muris TaxID=5742 RepID=A0A4Z1SW19_GIAMU|nr:ABC transporter [Giardia muris]|eukprot:TNJ29095.1 ABC transporter [Giardia muris]